MSNFLARVKAAAKDTAIAALATGRTLLDTEPVRVRAWLVSALVAVGAFVPALANGNTVQEIASIVLVVAPVLLGESARSRVSPVTDPIPVEPADPTTPDAPVEPAVS